MTHAARAPPWAPPPIHPSAVAPDFKSSSSFALWPGSRARLTSRVIDADVLVMVTICAPAAPTQTPPLGSPCLGFRVFVFVFYSRNVVWNVCLLVWRLPRRLPGHHSHLHTQPLPDRQSRLSTRWAPPLTPHLMLLVVGTDWRCPS